MGLGRVDGGGSARGPEMTMDQAHAVMRSIGEAGDPTDPRYAQVRAAVVDAIYRQLPGVHLRTMERATGIFHTFRTHPHLIPSAPPTRSPLSSD